MEFTQVIENRYSCKNFSARQLAPAQLDAILAAGRVAPTALTQAGIRFYGGVSGDADAAVLALLAGKLGYDPDVRCTHHDEAHGEGSHTCGSHGCGNHSCH